MSWWKVSYYSKLMCESSHQLRLFFSSTGNNNKSKHDFCFSATDLFRGLEERELLAQYVSKISSSGGKIWFFDFSVSCGTSPDICSDWMMRDIYVHKQGTAAVSPHPRHQVGFSTPAEVCALQCVLSTKTAPLPCQWRDRNAVQQPCRLLCGFL